MKLQYRVSSALAALVAVFVVAQGTLSYLSLEEQEDRIADELVLTEARQLRAYAERGDLDGPRASDLLDRGADLAAWLVRPDGTSVPAGLPPELSTLTDGPHRVVDARRHLHIVAVSTGAGRLIVAYDAQRNEEQVHQYGLYLIGLGALCIAAALAMARQLARIVLAPMERLSTRLSDWVPGDPEEAPHRTSDEEARLVAAFARVQKRFERAIAHEREFGTNLGHELRTPLAALRSDIEMLGETAALPDAQRVRLHRMTATVDALAGAIESARALSGRRREPVAPVALARCIDDAWLIVQAGAPRHALSVDNRVPAATTVVADRHALLTIVRNLLQNAAEHAAPARCVVSGDTHRLTIEDDGPGIAAADLPFVFERAWRGPRADRADRGEGGEGGEGGPAESGRGLGLSIARQIAELNGWTLAVEPRPGRGVRFTLAFADPA
ncbi:MAG: sensor histidine kinase [Burkholderiales bacterium]|nr:MAG: sensor histidine kinase [Burkholderiales bacterium]